MKYTTEIKNKFIIAKGTEREVEIPFMLDNMPEPPKRILDVSCCYTHSLSIFEKLGFDIYGIDLLPYKHKKFIKADARNIPFKDNYFDVVTCISAMEHFGLVQTPYKTDKVEDKIADIKAILEMKRILKPNGLLILTLPYGKLSFDLKTWIKEYDKKAIDKLINISELKLVKVQYGIEKNDEWVITNEETASEVLSSNKVLSNISLLLKKE